MMDSDNIDTTLFAGDLPLREKLDALPQKPGVYRFKDAAGTVLYVGKAQSLRSRVRQYFQKSRTRDPRIDAMIAKVQDIEITVTDTEVEALILESNLIKEIKPRYNVVLKDDKSYPYIVITNEPFPRVFVTRRKFGDGGKYFGPYTDVGTMRAALKTVRDIFRIRSCNYDLSEESVARHKFKVCLDYHIKKCDGPCEAHISREAYAAMISHVARILSGRIRSVVESLDAEMQRAAGAMQFEEAAAIRDKIRQLNVYRERQKIADSREINRDIFSVVTGGDDGCGVLFSVREGKVIGSRHFYFANGGGKSRGELLQVLLERYYSEHEDYPDEIVVSEDPTEKATLGEWIAMRSGQKIDLFVPEKQEDLRLVELVRNNAQYWLDELQIQRLKRGETAPHTVQDLQKDLRLAALPRRIECFDISNIQGNDSVASMVVFVDGKPKKSEYRKFRIRTVQGPDDFASMQEVIQRRYTQLQNDKASAPNLIIVDGGKGQLSSAVEILDSLSLQLPIIGLAKRLEEIFVRGQTDPILLPKTSSSLRLLQRIRDEAHRFAVTYHRQVRSRRILQTEIDLIKGVGKKRSKELLEAFGSVQGIKFASLEQLADVVGGELAGHIKEYFL
jgi:excinuclease ABC subunit C